MQKHSRSTPSSAYKPLHTVYFATWHPFCMMALWRFLAIWQRSTLSLVHLTIFGVSPQLLATVILFICSCLRPATSKSNLRIWEPWASTLHCYLLKVMHLAHSMSCMQQLPALVRAAYGRPQHSLLVCTTKQLCMGQRSLSELPCHLTDSALK